MAEINQVYKCSICGNIIEVVHAGKGTLVCCNKPMFLEKENTTDAAKEKHVPSVEKSGSTVAVTVGSVEHPMEEKHYIEWIEVVTPDKVYRKYLKPGEKPKAEFVIDKGEASVRAYCNLHGLWKA